MLGRNYPWVGVAGSGLLVLGWAILGLWHRTGLGGPLVDFGQATVFMLLPALIGGWLSWQTRRKPAFGLLLFLFGLPGIYLWSQAQVFLVFEKKEGMLESSLALLGACLYLVCGYYAIKRKKAEN